MATRRLVPVALLLALVTMANTLIVTEAGRAKPRYRIRSAEVAEGVTFTRIRDRKGPRRIKVLEIDPSTALTLDLALAKDKLPGLERTSDLAARRGAVAAVNGTYYLPSGRPLGTFIEDGDFKTTPLSEGNAFSMSFDEQQTYFGPPKPKVNLYDPNSGLTYRVKTWNERDPLPGEIAGYSVPAGRVAKPPLDACSVRVQPASGVIWGPSGVGFEGDYTVEKTKCDDSRLRRGGGIVLSAPIGTQEAVAIGSFFPGQNLRLSWAVGWPHVLDVIPGNPLLVSDGVNVAYRCDAPFCKKHPRTGIGVTAEGDLLLVTVDGRRDGYSIGMNLVQFARIFEMVGATWALNLDGGGSTTMVLDGEVVNRPSDPSGERWVGSAVLVLPGPDPDEPTPAPYSSPTAAPSPLPSPSSSPSPIGAVTPRSGSSASGGSFASALSDPASIGGLLDAIARGELIGSPRLVDDLRWVVSVFRRS